MDQSGVNLDREVLVVVSDLNVEGAKVSRTRDKHWIPLEAMSLSCC